MTTTQKNRFDIISKDDPERTLKLASYCARTAYENRAENIEVLDISELCSYADFFVIASGQNRNQLLAIAEHTECEMEANNLFKIGIEGRKDESGWILLDYGNIIVQLFDSEAREFYQLEELWADAPELTGKKLQGLSKKKTRRKKTMIKVKLVGATGYGGVGLIELILRHPQVEIASLVAANDTGKPVSHFWPHLAGLCDEMVYAAGEAGADTEADIVVYSTPDGIGMQLAPEEIAKGRKVLDYSGDFRFNSDVIYEEYASRQGLDKNHKSPDLLNKTIYGLAELHRDKIAKADIVGNPGCFAVSCILGLAPAVKESLIEKDTIICDCKTGISGAGKKPKQGFHYPEAYDNTYAYKLAGHQHVMEVEHELSLLANSDVKITFTPQVVPMTRGIISSLYGKLSPGTTQEKVLSAYREFYKESNFIRVADTASSTGHVRGSNFVNITVACDERTGTFRVISHIDNLMKGQAGSAMQNINIMFGMDEMLGLDFPGAHP